VKATGLELESVAVTINGVFPMVNVELPTTTMLGVATGLLGAALESGVVAEELFTEPGAGLVTGAAFVSVDDAAVGVVLLEVEVDSDVLTGEVSTAGGDV
jgi:hypothetical protein